MYNVQCTVRLMCINYIYTQYQYYVPHKAVAEVSRIANYRMLVAANHGSQRLRSVAEVVVAVVAEMKFYL